MSKERYILVEHSDFRRMEQERLNDVMRMVCRGLCADEPYIRGIERLSAAVEVSNSLYSFGGVAQS